jgi:hypothetical protein
VAPAGQLGPRARRHWPGATVDHPCVRVETTVENACVRVETTVDHACVRVETTVGRAPRVGWHASVGGCHRRAQIERRDEGEVVPAPCEEEPLIEHVGARELRGGQ